MKLTGNTKKIPLSICCECGAEIEHVEEVCTLPACGCGMSTDKAEPAEYDWSCPECRGMSGWDEIEKETER